MQQGATRRQFAAGLGAGGLAPGIARSGGARHPNVLLVISDQWSALASEPGQGHVLRTPATDRLAAQGASFGSSYCTYPLCSPSRSSLITGRMPHQTRVIANVGPNSSAVPAAIPTLGEVFSRAGYDTGYFGKEHVGGAGYRGFKDLGSVQYPRGGYIADGSVLDPVFVRDATAFIQAPRSNPFLAVLSLINPHDICYQPPHATIPAASIVEVCTALWPGKYLRGRDLPPPRPNLRAAAPQSAPRTPRAQDAWGDREWSLYLGNYYLLIENTDWLIGLILDALRAAGLEKDTLVLFTSDHGDQMGAHQLVGKGVFYEEAARVPFVTSWPGVVKPGVVNNRHLVSGTDVLPTLCDYAGLPLPEGIPGRSVRPLIEDRPVSWRDYVVGETTDGRMLRTGPHKYFTYRRPGDPEFLFDLARDPGETVNLAGDAQSRPVLERCRRLLARWMEDSGGGFEATARRPAPGAR
jgi:arylsulfatase A-like enzyme